MLAEMYKRREKHSRLFLIFTVAVMIGFLILQTPETLREWWELLFFLFPVGLILSIIFISRQQYNKVKDIPILESEKELFDVTEVVVKKDMALLPRLLLFEPSGELIAEVKPIDVDWWMRVLLAANSELISIFPLTFGFFSQTGEKLITFRKKGWLKQVELKIFEGDQRKIGTYIQEELKAFIHIKGELFDELGNTLLAIKVSGFSGNFSWSDEEGRQWASFSKGFFPHEYTELFSDSHNHIVKLSDGLTEDDKVRLLAVIGYLFMARIKD
ncbi:hypothetical protein [Planococcus beigongshangi]|uniref:hypothetical protein n=1 Tax=Planococcus beigongshangi TaxID=2782536 RepID=UPI00193BF3D5|nr:hypothetical protein [Planococcus beigongshangi]